MGRHQRPPASHGFSHRHPPGLAHHHIRRAHEQLHVLRPRVHPQPRGSGRQRTQGLEYRLVAPGHDQQLRVRPAGRQLFCHRLQTQPQAAAEKQNDGVRRLDAERPPGLFHGRRATKSRHERDAGDADARALHARGTQGHHHLSARHAVVIDAGLHPEVVDAVVGEHAHDRCGNGATGFQGRKQHGGPHLVDHDQLRSERPDAHPEAKRQAPAGPAQQPPPQSAPGPSPDASLERGEQGKEQPAVHAVAPVAQRSPECVPGKRPQHQPQRLRDRAPGQERAPESLIEAVHAVVKRGVLGDEAQITLLYGVGHVRIHQ